MKKLLLFTLLCALMMPAHAAVESITEIFGKYKFTATMEVTDAGQAHKDKFAAESEVTITTDPLYPGVLMGLAGATGGSMDINNLKTIDGVQKLEFLNASYNYPWGAPLGITDMEGTYPFSGGCTLYITIGDDGNLTVPDFTIVSCDHSIPSATILAKFTDCKLTLVEKEVLVCDDMSGDWHFTCADDNSMAESTFPTEFDMTLTALDTTYSSYTAAITFEGYEPMNFAAKYDGQNITMDFDSTMYIDAANKIAFYNYYSSKSRNGTITFQASSTSSMMLTGGMLMRQEVTADSLATVQYYIYGYATKAVSFDVDFAGKYTVTPEVITYNPDRKTDITWPETFEIEIQYIENWGGYYVTTFLDQDTYSMNYGGIPAVVSESDPRTIELNLSEANSLKYIATIDDAAYQWAYATLCDNTGLNTGKIGITINEDGTISISDFSVVYAITNSTEEPVLDAYFQNNTITKKAEAVDFSGTWTATVAAEDVTVTDSSWMSFPTTFEMDFDYSDYWSTYYISYFIGDVYGINYGGFSTVLAENQRSMTIDLNSSVTIKYSSDYSEKYVLRDANGTTDGTISIEAVTDSTLTMSDFTICHIDASNNSTIVASYKNVTIKKGGIPIDFTKTYPVKVDSSILHVKDASYYTFPTEWEIGFIDYGEGEYGGIVLSKWLGKNISSINYGGITVNKDADDYLTLHVDLSGWATNFCYTDTTYSDKLVVRDSLGTTTNTIDITISRDRKSATVSNFSIFLSASGKESVVAIYGRDFTQSTAIENVSATEKAGIYAADGIIYVAAEPTYVEVYNTVGACIYKGIASQINGLNRGIYIVKAGKNVTRVIL